MPDSSTEVRLTRRVTFSAGHRYWIPSLSEEENRRLFGKWASPFNHGHNYVLDVTTTGSVQPATGMVVNIKDIDEVLQERVVRQFDGKSIPDEVEHFQAHASTLENLLLYIQTQLYEIPPAARLTSLRLEEMPTLWAEYNVESQPRMTLTRSYEFAASHRLHSDKLSPAENLDVFGKCNNPAGHGHNYVLEVTVSGEPDARTGMMVDLEALDAAVQDLVVDRYDHKNFNCDLPEFAGLNPTSEVVAQKIWERLNGALPASLYRIRLHETARNIFEISL